MPISALCRNAVLRNSFGLSIFSKGVSALLKRRFRKIEGRFNFFFRPFDFVKGRFVFVLRQKMICKRVKKLLLHVFYLR